MVEYNKEMLKALPLFERAVVLATLCHAGTKDKGGNTYILHPITVAMNLKTEDERIVGLLHDSVEDKKIAFEDLRALGFPEHIVKAIDSVTRREGETYMEFIIRSKQNSIGKNVKLKDIDNNMDISRISNPTEKDYNRLKKYRKAKLLLLED